MENKVKQVLTKARGLLTDPMHWTAGCLARDALARQVEPYSKTAESWCSIGAIRKVARDQNISNECAAKAERILEKAVRGWGVAHWNDRSGRRHSTILKGFDKAIELAGQCD